MKNFDLEIQYNDFLISSLYQIDCLKEHNLKINHIDFSQDGSLLLSSGDDDLLCIYDIQSSQIIYLIYNKLHGTTNALFTIAPDEILYCGKYDHRIILMSCERKEVLYTFYGHKSKIIDMKLNFAKNTLLSTSDDYQTFLWNLTLKNCEAIFSSSLSGAFDSSGEIICHAKLDGNQSLILFYNRDTITKMSKPFKKFNPLQGIVKSMQISNSGEYIVVMFDKEICIIDSDSGIINNLFKINDTQFTVFDISPDSNYLAIGDNMGSVSFRNVQTGKDVLNKEYHLTGCTCVKFSGEFSIFATSSEIVMLLEPNFENRNIVSAI